MADSDNLNSASIAVSKLDLRSPDQMQACWDQYFPRLQALTIKTLRYLPHRHEDAADAAQSAFVSFWKAAERGDILATLDRNSLWKLLATIAVRKARKAVRREFAEKRGAGKVRPFSALSESASQNLEALLSNVSTVSFDIAAEERLESLPEELRRIALLRLFNHTNAEIAERLNCSERRIERKLRVIKSQWELSWSKDETS